MRWFKSLFKGITFSTMAASAVVLAGGVGCGDESFNFCECKFACTANYPDPADPTLMLTVNTDLSVCQSGEFTYGDCGVFCKSTFPQQLLGLETVPLCACGPGCENQCYEPVPGVVGPPTVATMTMCAMAPAQTLAKNSCSPGTPVGE